MPTRAQLNSNLAVILTPVVEIPAHLQTYQMILDYLDQQVSGVTANFDLSNYYNKTQVNVIADSKITTPTGATEGSVIKYTGGSIVWGDGSERYITGTTFNNNKLSINDNAGNSFSTFINNFTGLTVNGIVSGTTYYGDGSHLTGVISVDVNVTGGTYNQATGIATFRNNQGGTFAVSGFLTGYTDSNFVNTDLTAIEDRTHEFNHHELNLNNVSQFSVTNILGSTGFTAFDDDTMIFESDTAENFFYLTIPTQITVPVSVQLNIDGSIEFHDFILDIDFGDGTSGYFNDGEIVDATSVTCLGFNSSEGGTPVDVILQVEKTAFDASKDVAYFDGDRLLKARFIEVDTLQSVTSRNNITNTSIISSVGNGGGGTDIMAQREAIGLSVYSMIGILPGSFGSYPYLQLSYTTSIDSKIFKILNQNTSGTILQNENLSGATLGLLFQEHATISYLTKVPQGNGYLGLSVNGHNADINGNISLTGLSASDTFVTGGTFSSGTITFRNNTGGTFNVTGITFTDTTLTGGTYSNGTITFRNNTGGTFNVTGITFTDISVTGGTYNQGTGVATFTNNTGGTFTLSGFTISSGINSVSAIGSSANASGATISGTTLTLQPASASFGGIVTTGTQTFAGNKTFNGSLNTGAIDASSSTITTPLIFGGTGTTSTLTLVPTSGTGTTGSNILFKVGTSGSTLAGTISNAGAWDLGTGSITIGGNIFGFTFLGSGNIRCGVSSNYSWNGRSTMSSPSDGQITLSNAATSGFNRLNFGTNLSGSTALSFTGTTINARLADDSAYAPIQSLYQRFGTGSPESVVTAPIGAFYSRTDGSTGTSLYVKESGSGNTGWVAK